MTFHDGWLLFKSCFKVIWAEKRLLFIPLVVTILFFVLIGLVVGANILTFMAYKAQIQEGSKIGLVSILVSLFLFIFILGFFIAFGNIIASVCATRFFQGYAPSLIEGFSTGVKRLKNILIWAGMATVVAFLYMLARGKARKAGGAGGTGLQIFAFLGLFAWSLAATFVIPIIAIENLSPLNALKQSVGYIKKTWGELIVGFLGFGAVNSLLILFCLIGIPLLFAVLGAILGLFNPLLIGVMLILGFGLGGFGLFFVIFLNAILATVFHTSLYIYAKTGKMPLAIAEGIKDKLVIKRQ